MLKKMWPDPVWSKVISAGIIAVFVAVGSYLIVWFPTVRQWIIAESAMPNWLFIISCVAILWKIVDFVRKGLSAMRGKQISLRRWIGITELSRSLEEVTKQLGELRTKVQSSEQTNVAGGNETNKVPEIVEAIGQIQTELTSTRETADRLTATAKLMTNAMPIERALPQTERYILELLEDSDQPLSATEIAKSLGIPISASSTLLRSLIKRGVVKRNRSNDISEMVYFVDTASDTSLTLAPESCHIRDRILDYLREHGKPEPADVIAFDMHLALSTIKPLLRSLIELGLVQEDTNNVLPLPHGASFPLPLYSIATKTDTEAQ